MCVFWLQSYLLHNETLRGQPYRHTASVVAHIHIAYTTATGVSIILRCYIGAHAILAGSIAASSCGIGTTIDTYRIVLVNDWFTQDEILRERCGLPFVPATRVQTPETQLRVWQVGAGENTPLL